MPSYRFCRPDDIPSLVEGVQRCFDVHFPHQAGMTLDRFRSEMRTHDVWPSNSLLAWDEDRPVAVLIGTKRPHAVQIRRLGVAPDALRQGHGSHLLTSISQKLAVLGPPRLVAEVPEENAEALAAFRACHYVTEAVLTDWIHDGGTRREVPADWIAPTPAAELLAEGLFSEERLAWDRQPATLRQASETLQGWAAASFERIEAGLLVEEDPGGDRVLAWGTAASDSAPSGSSRHLLGLLLGRAASVSTAPLRLPALEEGELPTDWLHSLGFRPERRILFLTAVARPA